MSDEKNKPVEQDYFGDFEGHGLDQLTPDVLSTAYLSMVQAGGSAVTTHPQGTWINSATGENYGKSVEVVILDVRTVWVERDKDPPFLTVGRYLPNSIDVDITKPKPGSKGYPKMVNPITGNQVQELLIYALMVADRPEDGVLLFSPAPTSMQACKKWNTLVKSARLPDGRQLLAAYTWNIELDLVANKAKPAEKLTVFSKATRGKIVERELFIKHVRPQLVAKNNIALLAAPETTGEAE